MVIFVVRFLRWTVGFVSLALLGVGLGEAVILGGFVVLLIYGLFSERRVLRVGLPVVACAGLVLHAFGFKIYGAPTFKPDQRLSDAEMMVSLLPPSTIQLANGESVVLSGIYFPAHLRLDEFSERQRSLLLRLGHSLDVPGIEVRIDRQAGTGECLQRLEYSCGNTFFPTGFPRRLPRHKQVDLAELLVAYGLALPNFEGPVLTDECERFVKILDGSWFRPDSALVRRGDERVIALGRELVKPESVYFVTGAYLLIAAQDVERYAELKREVLRRQGRNRADYDRSAQHRSTDLETVLAWIDPEIARSRVLEGKEIIGDITNGRDGHNWVRDAWLLASHGDLSAFDSAAKTLADPRAPAVLKQQLSEHIPRYFQWPGDTREFGTWYARQRANLRAGRDEVGRVAVWLEGGMPFDHRYKDSIDEVIRGSGAHGSPISER